MRLLLAADKFVFEASARGHTWLEEVLLVTLGLVLDCHNCKMYGVLVYLSKRQLLPLCSLMDAMTCLCYFLPLLPPMSLMQVQAYGKLGMGAVM